MAELAAALVLLGSVQTLNDRPELAPRMNVSRFGRVDVAKLGWAAGEFGLACYTGVASIYLLFYATETLGIPPAWAGLSLLVPRLWNLVGDPIVGVLSDRTHSRFGRRRPFLLIGALVWGAAFCLMFNLPHIDRPWLAALVLGLVFLLNNTGLTLYQVPYAAMLAEITRDHHERTRLVAYREVVARAAILLTLACAPWILATASNRQTGFQVIGMIFGGAILVSGLVAFFATSGAPQSATESRGSHRHAQWAALAHNKPLKSVTLSFLCVNLGDAMFSGSLVYFVTEILGRSPAVIGTLYPVSSVTGIIAAPLWMIIANRYGRTTICRLALGFSALCCLLPLLISRDNYWLMYPFMCIYGFFNTGARLLPNAIVPDTVEVDQRRTGERREGLIFGIFVFVQQSGFAVGGFLLSALLALVTHQGAADRLAATRLTGIALTFTVASAVFYGVAFLWMLTYRAESEKSGAATTG
jgi:GPH family glycoside/pentoside/hexuronide:cation symporter